MDTGDKKTTHQREHLANVIKGNSNVVGPNRRLSQRYEYEAEKSRKHVQICVVALGVLSSHSEDGGRTNKRAKGTMITSEGQPNASCASAAILW